MGPSVKCMEAVILLSLFVLTERVHAATGTHVCDVVVAGGSLASAAAAIAASETSTNTTRICFLEITNWPGGQASAGGDSAMDFGLQYVNFPHNIPRSLADLLTDGKMGGPEYNPGECLYLPKCVPPKWIATSLLNRLAAAPNVVVLLNTSVVGVDRDATGRVTGLRAVQRRPTAQHPSGWDRPLSQALPDWYSTTPSEYFDKTPLQVVVAQVWWLKLQSLATFWCWRMAWPSVREWNLGRRTVPCTMRSAGTLRRSPSMLNGVLRRYHQM